jgi:hypothetical protein
MARVKGENWRAAIKKWLAELRGIPGAGSLRVELVESRSEGGHSVALDSWAIGEHDEPTDTDIRTKVDEFLLAAQEDTDARDTRGPFSYCLMGRDTEDDRPLGRTAGLRFFNDSADENFGEGLEPANSRGLLGQLMRHNEAMAKTMTSQSASYVEGLARMVTTLQQQALDTERRRIEAFEKYEQAATLKHDRDLAAIKAAGEQERMDAMFKQFQPYIPVVMAKIASTMSGKALPPKPDESVVSSAATPAAPNDDAKLLAIAIADLMKTFHAEPEKFAKLSEILNEGQIMALVQISESCDRVLGGPGNG